MSTEILRVLLCSAERCQKLPKNSSLAFPPSPPFATTSRLSLPLFPLVFLPQQLQVEEWEAQRIGKWSGMTLTSSPSGARHPK